MVLHPATATLAGLLLALPAAVPVNVAAPAAPLVRAADVSGHSGAGPVAGTLAGPPGAPPGVCPSGTGYGPPLPATSVVATKIRSGFSFLEGPVWIADRGYLLFSDMGAATGSEYVQPSTIRRFTPPATFDTFLPNAGSNGLALTPDGQQLVAATHDQRSVSTYRLDNLARGVVAGNYQGRAFNSPNDVAVRSDGVVYFTDPNFQRGNRPDQMSGRTSVFRVSGGQVSLVDDALRQPNGIALSPDGGTLYVGAYGENKIYKYAVQPDGSTGPRSVFVNYVGGPDGGTIDCAGNVYWTSGGDGLVHVYSPTGTQLGTIRSGSSGTTNVAFGGSDRRTLFVTSGRTNDSGLYSVRLNVPGYPY
ncbi:SMP-30/gluconolactonase/LRE family protein [Micromonospora sp. WMMD987]|uniref:SMP-30/gluconolactonase/LRE family protein n=1 Tax=Micromonospora sp. WMMD987 TaxID=3016089 RepID=UPI00249B49A6|nr:SMP-30/gluconolactonase/LRE family protein [Micromonospora sp. WMMD987]WFE95252.1 SMP-30/gluconolactonase/LRE family protein [Micromonospora sp. WMMD987]